MKNLDILVIDSETEFGELLRDCLSDWGHRVEVVGDLAKLRTWLEHVDFDWILCDLHLPSYRPLGGFLGHVQALSRSSRTRIGVLTGNLDVGSAPSLGVDFVLRKPFSIYRLHELLGLPKTTTSVLNRTP